MPRGGKSPERGDGEGEGKARTAPAGFHGPGHQACAARRVRDGARKGPAPREAPSRGRIASGKASRTASRDMTCVEKPRGPC